MMLRTRSKAAMIMGFLFWWVGWEFGYEGGLGLV